MSADSATQSSTSPLLALLLERKARNTARAQLTSFARLAGYEPAPHHLLLIERLEKLAKGEIRRLMVFMPPGSAKSTYTSILLPAWYLAQEGSGNVLAASHTTELAERFGRKVRTLVNEYGLQLGYGLSPDSQAAGRWETSTGREYFAVGAGVGVAGFRAKLNIVDDPFRSRADADSKLIRDRVWEWYNDDLDNRAMPHSSTALVMTRWHDDDLAGRLLARAETGVESWDVLSLPAIAEEDDPLGRAPGEWLWEGEYGYASRLREKHATSEPRSWAALYQQRPTPDTGDYFKREWLQYVEHAPNREAMRIYGGSDYAVTERGGDYTVHAVVGLDYDGNPWLLDIWRKQASSEEWIAAYCDLVLKWKPLGWAEEQGQIRAGVGPFLVRESRQRGAHVAREVFPTRGDKSVRAQSFRGLIATRGLRIARGAPWRSEVEGELLRFPAGVHDDIVDALGLVGQLMDKMTVRPRPVAVVSHSSGYRPIGDKGPARSFKVM